MKKCKHSKVEHIYAPKISKMYDEELLYVKCDSCQHTWTAERWGWSWRNSKYFYTFIIFAVLFMVFSLLTE